MIVRTIKGVSFSTEPKDRDNQPGLQSASAALRDSLQANAEKKR